VPFVSGAVSGASTLNAYVAFATSASHSTVTGTSGSAVKRDALTKHMGSTAHMRAEALENGPLPLTEILYTTAVGKPQKIISHASSVVIIFS